MEDGLTACLRQVRENVPGAEIKLLEVVYNQLRRMAGQRMRRERPDHTLEPNALANEVWLRLVTLVRSSEWRDSDHLLATCAKVMRNILIDYARRRKFLKVDLELVAGIHITAHVSEDLLALDDGLQRLAQFDPRGARVLELIVFAGFSQKEVAEALKISERTVKRDYSACRLWLRTHMRRTPQVPLQPPRVPGGGLLQVSPS